MNNKIERKEIDVLEYWHIILKRKWILVTFAAVLVVFVAIFSFTSTPLYRATASIMIEEPSSNMLNIQDIMGYGGYYRSDYLGTFFNTQLKLLTSRSLAERVAKKMNFPARPEFLASARSRTSLFQSVKNLVTLRWLFTPRKPADRGEKAQYQPNPYSAYAFTVLGGLSITPVEETRLVDVSYTSSHPVLAADIVNTLVEEFISFSIESRYEATQQASEFLTEEIAKLRDDLGAKERDLQRYGEEKKLLFLSKDESSVVNKFADVSSALTEAQVDRIKKESLFRELRSLKADALPQFISNPLIQSLKTSYTQTKNEFDERSKVFKPDYPEMIKLRTRMDSMKSELQSEIRKAVDASEADFRASQKKEASLQNMLESQRTEVSKMDSNAILYNSLRIEVENMRNLLNSLVAKQNETLVSARLGGLRTSNIKIIDRALVPGGPFTPNTRRNLLMALLVGLFGGLGLIFLVEYMDNTVKGPEDAEKITGLPSLGIIPFLSPDGLKKRSDQYGSYSYGAENAAGEETMPEVSEIELINHLFPKFSISEDYRTVRTSILFSHSDSQPKTICFTSTLPQEGKTATVSNIAVSFAQLEGKVLLVDCDMRKPRLHRIFKVRNLVGLSGYLTGKVTFEDAIQKTSIENIWILPSGPHPPNPAELLNSRRMKEFMALVKERFDVILLDTPPVLAVIDPVIISSLSDCTVIVIRAGKTTRKPLAKAVAEIRKAKSEVIGVIFNEVRIGRQGTVGPYYHYYQYEYASVIGEKKKAGDKEEFQVGGRPENKTTAPK
jgi:capsular exopolysaccharide synthesis family protein